MLNSNSYSVTKYPATQHPATQYDYFRALAAISLVASLVIFPSLAYAGDPFTSGATWFTELLGDIAKVLFPIVMIFLGFATWTSKLTMRLAMYVAGGSVLVFGAAFYAKEIMAALNS